MLSSIGVDTAETVGQLHAGCVFERRVSEAVLHSPQQPARTRCCTARIGLRTFEPSPRQILSLHTLTGGEERLHIFLILSLSWFSLDVRFQRRRCLRHLRHGSSNQRPQAIAATGFPQPARAPRRAADRMDPAAMPRSSKAVRKAVRHALGDAQDCTMNDRT